MSQHEHEVKRGFQTRPSAEHSYRFVWCGGRQMARVVPVAHVENGGRPSYWGVGETWRKPNREGVCEMEAGAFDFGGFIER